MNNENIFNNETTPKDNTNEIPEVLEETTSVFTPDEEIQEEPAPVIEVTYEEEITPVNEATEEEAVSDTESLDSTAEEDIEANPYESSYEAAKETEAVNSQSNPFMQEPSAPPVYPAPPVYQTPQYPYQQMPPQNQYYNPQTPPVQQPVYYYQQPAAPTPPTNNQQPNFNYYPPTPPTPPERKKKGPNALLIILWILVGLFALGFFGLCGYIIGNDAGRFFSEAQTSDIPTLFSEDDKDEDTTKPYVTEQIDPDKNENVVPLPNDNKDLYSDKVKITLNEVPKDKDDTTKYTTQYAYKTVAESTIGVVCYENGFASEPVSQGTGIIASKDGYVITNSHVIGDSRSRYYVQVITNDGTIYEARIIGYDSRTDLAVLKIDAKDLTPANFCDSKYVEVGQDVIAVGNPGGLEFQNSLTRGVVSALNRELSLSSQVSYIQTDAAINPGNSGGPLCNIYGQVIGINTAKISASSYESMGFAIPSATVKEIVDDLISKGYVENRVRLGIAGTEVNSAMQQYYRIPAGILVGEISEGGPCDNKGIEQNDIITAIDDEEIETFSDIYAILAKHKPGDKVTLSVYKTDSNKTVEITVTLMADQGETQQ